MVREDSKNNMVVWNEKRKTETNEDEKENQSFIHSIIWIDRSINRWINQSINQFKKEEKQKKNRFKQLIDWLIDWSIDRL